MLNLISTIPSIRFENYLDKLIDRDDSPTSPIRVRGVEGFLKDSIGEIGKREIKNDLEKSTSCLRGWVRGRRGMPLSLLRRIVEIRSGSNLRPSIWDEIFKKIRYYTLGGSPHKVKLPLFANPRLLYFVGYLYDDGCISNAHKRSYEKGGLLYEIKIADFSQEQIEGIAGLFYQIFNVEAKIRDERISKGEQTYYIDPKCKIVHRFLSSVFEMPIGEKKNKLQVPSAVLQTPPKLRRWFIAGFFDADGSIFRVQGNGRKRNIVKFKQASLRILRDIQHLLNQDMGITLQGPYRNPSGAWSISSGERDTVEEFCKKVPLVHPKKRKLAREMIS